MRAPFRREKGDGQEIRYIGVPITYETSSDPEEIQKRLDDLTKEESSVMPPHNPEKLMDESRKTIAYWFVISFIIIIGAVLLLVPIYNAIAFHNARVIVQESTYQPLDIAQVLATLGTLLGTPLGFVVGYYFKEEHTLRRQNKNTSIDS